MNIENMDVQAVKILEQLKLAYMNIKGQCKFCGNLWESTHAPDCGIGESIRWLQGK